MDNTGVDFERNEELIKAIMDLKKSGDFTILAHYYQEPAIQEIADFVGDSLALAHQASKAKEQNIVLCGVHFMAETAKIINPGKRVFLPDTQAGCSLADSCQPADFKAFIDEHPDHAVVTYVNCSAEIKALSDYACTSSNAVEVIQSIPEDKPIIFAPDVNLGRYLQHETGRDIVLWDGACEVHVAFSVDKVKRLIELHPDAELIAHPESETHLLNMAEFIGSTGKLLKYVKESEVESFIVATEVGILHEMRLANPDKEFIPAPVYEENSCACSECKYMKMNTLDKLYLCMRDRSPEVHLEKNIIEDAQVAIDRMLSIT